MMDQVAILGAGAMGAALTTPATDNGRTTHLWGTWLDDELVDAIRAGTPHPRVGVRLDDRVRTFLSDALDDAVTGAELVVLAIASEGVLDVARRIRPLLRPGTPVALTTKGFGRDADGRVRLLPDLLAAVLGPETPLVAIGGPCKANEVAAGRPTATFYASTDSGALVSTAAMLDTPAYRIERSADVAGLEIAAACKNVYAIALGICDGRAETGGQPWHNLRSAVFAQAVRELGLLAVAVGGAVETAYGLPGSGDLEVTGLSGRNKVFGARLGAGERSGAALEAMRGLGQTVEGVPATAYAVEFAGQLVAEGALAADSLPLLGALKTILEERVDPLEALCDAVLPGAVQRR